MYLQGELSCATRAYSHKALPTVTVAPSPRYGALSARATSWEVGRQGIIASERAYRQNKSTYTICLLVLDNDGTRFYRTAVPQVFTFILQALRSRPPSMSWLIGLPT